MPFPASIDRIGPITAVRSTLVSSSLQAVRNRGLNDQYFAVLNPALHDEMRTMVAGTWVPIDIAREHYLAMDAIILSQDDRIGIGREVADKVQGSLLGTLARLATGAGVTPWAGLGAMHRLWDRIFQGGGVSVIKNGPKDAELHLAQFSLMDIGYFNGAFRGVAAAGLELFCRKAFISNLPRRGIVWRCKVSWA